MISEEVQQDNKFDETYCFLHRGKSKMSKHRNILKRLDSVHETISIEWKQIAQNSILILSKNRRTVKANTRQVMFFCIFQSKYIFVLFLSFLESHDLSDKLNFSPQ